MTISEQIAAEVSTQLSPIVDQLNDILRNSKQDSTPAKTEDKADDSQKEPSIMTAAVDNYLKGNEPGKSLVDNSNESKMPNLAQQEVNKENFSTLNPGVQSYLKHKAHDEIGGKKL